MQFLCIHSAFLHCRDKSKFVPGIKYHTSTRTNALAWRSLSVPSDPDMLAEAYATDRVADAKRVKSQTNCNTWSYRFSEE